MTTKVFISWSGDQSRKLAEALRQWLPGVLQFVKPYFTPDDIEKGARWGPDITKELDESQVGIICLTKDNLDKPWILFEAGALSKSFDKAKVCTVLFGVDTTDLKGPLTIFQHTRFDEADFKKLVKSINSTSGDDKLEDTVLDSVFKMWWPQLETKINKILAEHDSNDNATGRSERDILEEILELSRLNSRRKHPRDREIPPDALYELLEGLHEFAMIAATGDAEMLSSALRHIERPIHYIARHGGGRHFEERFEMLRREFEMMAMRSIEHKEMQKKVESITESS
jgi:hypothetical protein